MLNRYLRAGGFGAAIALMIVVLLHSAHIQAQSEPDVALPKTGKWSERMALSVIHRSPEAWAMRDYKLLDTPQWAYTYGLTLSAMQKEYERTGDERLLEYGKIYVDQLIDDQGHIKNYEIWDFNIDDVNAGKLLFLLYDKYGDERYLTAMNTLRRQLQWQPRTRSGGFWHKRIYPWQMWLDGLYMGAAYWAQYAHTFDEGKEAFSDIAHQFILIESKTRDPETGLLYHAWDESTLQTWADNETGLSPHFWSRAMGWYAMALVDTLEVFPEDHPDRQALVDILNRLAEALAAHQHESGLWYQVTDQGDRYGNYLEASGSSMFVYAMAKGVQEGYLPKRYRAIAEKGFDGLIKELVEVEASGEVHLTQICGSAGLGNEPYRPGTFEYYIGEAVRVDDPHGVGPFILAALALGR
ncbi:glycoside hydrolase family 88/105 protein [Marinimicrobium agarilyticum]|uniref:glycoside hydrolase family 88/105 protein n=1 Tax=Marinimicrobium agarilyticum TaxID=306546 RepID=UPI0003FF76D7|nr:glycoside hydrolase family 88 protein [Marinimicrobium agarilyticum]